MELRDPGAPQPDGPADPASGGPLGRVHMLGGRSRTRQLHELGLAASDITTFSWTAADRRLEVDPRILQLMPDAVGDAPTVEAWVERVVHPDDRARLLADIRAALDPAGAGTVRTEARIRLPDGTIRWLGVTGRATFSGMPSRVVSLAGAVFDVTDRKRVEDALRASEERYRTLFGSMFEGFSVIEILADEDGRPADFLVLESNPAQQLVTGRADATGRRASEMMPALESSWLELFDRVGRTGEPARLEIEVASIGRWFQVSATRMGERDSRLVALLYTDISDRKRFETEQARLLEQEREARTAAEAALRVRDDFLAIVSHELRTPLAAVLLWTRLLADGKVPGRDREALDIIVRNAEAQRVLTEDLLDASRAMAGMLDVALRLQPVAPVVADAVASAKAASDAAGVALEAGIGAQPRARIDADRLAQVLRNLIDNAVRHTPPGGHVEVSLRRVPGGVEIGVADDGDGIDPDVLPGIFDPFHRAQSPGGRPHGRLGLGLSISRDIVALHGGEISAASPGPGRGSVFTVRLPA